MADLSTGYMGLKLKNPVIASSSGITGSIDGIKRCADAGVGAVVLKSLFEEIIIGDSKELDSQLIRDEHPEAYEYMKAELGMRYGSRPYLRLIEDAGKSVSIPVIASINCSTPKWWVSYAKDMESAGASAIELNISHFPGAPGEDSESIEKRYSDIVNEVSKRVSIPVSVKLGMNFTSLYDAVTRMVSAGAKGVVLFNRFYNVDIDIKNKQIIPAMAISSEKEMILPLRWIGFLSDKIKCDFAASTGIHSSDTAIKMIMAGASAVQLCSVLYKKKPENAAKIISQINNWLDKNGYKTVNEIKGAAVSNTKNKEALFARLQYIKALEEAAKYQF